MVLDVQDAMDATETGTGDVSWDDSPMSTPLRPKLASWYMSRLDAEDADDTPKSKARSKFFEDNGQVLESTFLGNEDFPVPEERIRLSSFRPLKLLGRGGVGRVFLVLMEGSDRVYAMKQLKKNEMVVRNKVQRVMTEREIYKTTKHPFITTLHASFQTQKNLYFIMEYCSGGEFFRVLQKQPNNRLSEHAAKFYAAEVILALEYLHCVGFVYRDLKPENVLMRANGHIALTDFDLSKEGQARPPLVISKNQGTLSKLRRSLSLNKRNSGGRSKLFDLDIVDREPDLDRCFSFVGTEEYIAPEVIEGRSQTAAVDWWTVGVLIYEMLCGDTPFRGEQQTETFSRILHDDLIFPKGLNLSADCRNLLKRLLHKDPNKRLGKVGGASEIKGHKWFRDINFDLIRNEAPPIIPNIRDPLDMDQYRPLDDVFDGDEEEVSDDDDGENPFANFNLRKELRFEV